MTTNMWIVIEHTDRAFVVNTGSIATALYKVKEHESQYGPWLAKNGRWITKCRTYDEVVEIIRVLDTIWLNENNNDDSE